MMGYIEIYTREKLRKQSCQIILNLVQTSPVKLKINSLPSKKKENWK